MADAAELTLPAKLVANDSPLSESESSSSVTTSKSSGFASGTYVDARCGFFAFGRMYTHCVLGRITGYPSSEGTMPAGVRPHLAMCAYHHG